MINGDSVDEGGFMLEEGMNLPLFYCLCFLGEISIDMLGEGLVKRIERPRSGDRG